MMKRDSKHWDKFGGEELRNLQARRLRQYLCEQVIPFSKHYRELFAAEGIEIPYPKREMTGPAGSQEPTPDQ